MTELTFPRMAAERISYLSSPAESYGVFDCVTIYVASQYGYGELFRMKSFAKNYV